MIKKLLAILGTIVLVIAIGVTYYYLQPEPISDEPPMGGYSSFSPWFISGDEVIVPKNEDWSASISKDFEVDGNIVPANFSLDVGVTVASNAFGWDFRSTTVTGPADPSLITASSQHVTLEKLQLAVNSINFDFFFTDTASASNFLLTENETGEAESSIASGTFGISNDNRIVTYETIASQPEFTDLIAGQYGAHFHAQITSGGKHTELYWTLSKRAVGGAETLLLTSEARSITTTQAEYNLHASLLDDVALASTDRLVVKIYANISGPAGANVEVTISQEGTLASRVEVRTTTGAFSDIFWRLDGVNLPTGNWNMSGFNFTNVGFLSAKNGSVSDSFEIDVADSLPTGNNSLLKLSWSTGFSGGAGSIDWFNKNESETMGRISMEPGSSYDNPLMKFIIGDGAGALTTRLTIDKNGLFDFNGSASVSVNFEIGGYASISNTLWVNPAGNKRVGISNATPQELLHVGAGTDASDISATDLLVARAGPSNLSVRDSTNNVETFLFASSVGGIVGTVTDDPLNIQTNNTSAIFIDSSQNVGIGTTVPTTKFDVIGNASVSSNFEAGGFASVSALFGELLFPDGDCDNATDDKLLWDVSTGVFTCGTDQTGGGGAGTPLEVTDQTTSVNPTASISFGPHFVVTASNSVDAGITLKDDSIDFDKIVDTPTLDNDFVIASAGNKFSMGNAVFQLGQLVTDPPTTYGSGSMYYNTASNSFRCLGGSGTWTGCAGGTERARVYRSSNQVITTGTFQDITFDLERFDPTDMHDTVTNNERITFAVAGRYLVGVNARWAINISAAGSRLVFIELNDTTLLAGWEDAPEIVGNAITHLVSTMWDFDAGDYVKAIVLQNSGSSDTILASEAHTVEFWAIRMGDTGSDLAELMPTDETDLAGGELVSVKNAKIVRSRGIPYDDNIIGVVSIYPGYVIGGADAVSGQTQTPIALTGRVDIKVSDENGKVKEGDYLTSSSTPGVAMKATENGRVIGIALDNVDEDVNTVTTLINPHWYGGSGSTPQHHWLNRLINWIIDIF